MPCLEMAIMQESMCRRLPVTRRYETGVSAQFSGTARYTNRVLDRLGPVRKLSYGCGAALMGFETSVHGGQAVLGDGQRRPSKRVSVREWRSGCSGVFMHLLGPSWRVIYPARGRQRTQAKLAGGGGLRLVAKTIRRAAGEAGRVRTRLVRFGAPNGVAYAAAAKASSQARISKGGGSWQISHFPPSFISLVHDAPDDHSGRSPQLRPSLAQRRTHTRCFAFVHIQEAIMFARSVVAAFVAVPFIARST